MFEPNSLRLKGTPWHGGKSMPGSHACLLISMIDFEMQSIRWTGMGLVRIRLMN
jgi:hypothetical protein